MGTYLWRESLHIQLRSEYKDISDQSGPYIQWLVSHKKSRGHTDTHTGKNGGRDCSDTAGNHSSLEGRMEKTSPQSM